MLSEATAILAALVSLLCWVIALGSVILFMKAVHRVWELEDRVKRAEAALVGEPAPPNGRARVPATAWEAPQ